MSWNVIQEELNARSPKEPEELNVTLSTEHYLILTFTQIWHAQRYMECFFDRSQVCEHEITHFGS